MTDAWRRLGEQTSLVVLDGGLATELARRGHDLDDPLWSARLLIDDPEAIVRVHLDFFRAGADVATTASYQASLGGLRARGLSEAAAVDVLRTAVRLAARARDRLAADGRVRVVAASAGSYGATLANGAEYTGDFGPIARTEIAAFHRERAQILEDGADVIAFETIPSIRELEAIVDAMAGLATPAWVSMTLRDARTLASGEPLVRAAEVLAAAPGIVAVGVNCCAPWHVLGALTLLGQTAAKPRIAYPNGGEPYDGRARRFVGAPLRADAFAELARGCALAGARGLGACCRTGIGHIVALDRLRRALDRDRAGVAYTGVDRWGSPNSSSP
jgi:homocysteine S-methyltransferase